jgi:coproporphyrinogen III oxidase-like Fe-S oxidoreductase
MLELTKKILTKVSFDAQLFQKELNKALKWITDAEEIQKFQEWCIKEFGSKYPVIIKKAFAEANVS